MKVFKYGLIIAALVTGGVSFYFATQHENTEKPVQAKLNQETTVPQTDVSKEQKPTPTEQPVLTEPSPPPTDTPIDAPKAIESNTAKPIPVTEQPQTAPQAVNTSDNAEMAVQDYRKFKILQESLEKSIGTLQADIAQMGGTPTQLTEKLDKIVLSMNEIANKLRVEQFTTSDINAIKDGSIQMIEQTRDLLVSAVKMENLSGDEMQAEAEKIQQQAANLQNNIMALQQLEMEFIGKYQDILMQPTQP